MSIFHSKEQDGTINVFVCGKVTRDADVRQNNKGSKVKFSVCYGKKKYMDCEAWSDSPVGAAAACLEAGDYIGVAGTYRSWEYNGKNYSTVDADMIVSLVGVGVVSEADGIPPSATTYEELADDDSELPFD